MRFFRRFMYKQPGPALLLLALAALPASAAVVSTFSFNSGMDCQGVWRLPDTGQTQCFDNQSPPVAGACPGGGNGTGTGGQDGVYGPVAVQPSYTVLNPVGISSVTVDNVTGLMWVTNPMTDAGFNGKHNWESALTSCTVTLNGMAYAGYTDWRLPNMRELLSIGDYGKTTAPCVDATYFPGTFSDYYWTSTTKVSDTLYARYVTFSSCSGNVGLKTNSAYVRCVRGGPY